MKKLVLGCSLLLLSIFSIQAQNMQIDKVIAIVGGDVILWSDVEAQLKLMESQSEVDLPEDVRCAIFEQLLANGLILAEAERDSVVVDDAEVDDQIDSRIQQILAYMGGDPVQFEFYYGMTPMEMKQEMRDDMRKQLTIQRMQAQISASVTVTPKEVKDFFARIPKDSLPYFNSEVELGEIVIKPKVNPKEDEKARSLAAELRRQIVEDSADFATLAKKYSDDVGSGQKGGDLGIVPRGQFVPEFEAVAYQLQKGEISDLVKSEFGYHIIQLIERLGNNIHTRHILIRPRITFEDEERAKSQIDSIRKIIKLDSMTFDQAIGKHSEDDFSKTRNGTVPNPMTGEPFIETGDLDTEIFFAIESMGVGDISEPIESRNPQSQETTYRIVQIRNRTEPHVANLKDDYSRIYKAALEEKKALYLVDWIDKKIKENFIEIKITAADQNMFDCVFLKKWRGRA